MSASMSEAPARQAIHLRNMNHASDSRCLLFSQDFQDLYHTVHADPSARAKVPILQDGDLTLIESSLTVRP